MKNIVLLAAFALAAAPAVAADAARVKELSQVCAACHGADGNSASGDFPRIAGQYPDYIYNALQQYKSGKRKAPVMQGQVANLNREDMRALAAYFASQSGLYTKR